MRRIKFENNEKALLRLIISLGYKEANDYHLFEIKESLLKKLSNEILVINTKELQLLISYTQNSINQIEDIIKEINQKFYGKDPSQYCFIDDISRNFISSIDTYFSIKEKLTKEKQFYYKTVLENIDRIKLADNFFISLSDKKPYKIAIVQDNNILEWDFYSDTNFEDKKFIKLTKRKEQELKCNYKSNVNRIQISEIFNNYEPRESETNFIFLRYLLN